MPLVRRESSRPSTPDDAASEPTARFRQPSQREPPDRRNAHQVPDQHRELRICGQLVVAVRHDDHHTRLLDPAGEHAKHVQRRRIRPMRIFDHRDRRRGRPQRIQQRPRQREPIGPVRRGTGSRHRREQLEHRAERDRHRQRLARADRECRPAPQPGPQRPHQRRLTDPRLARDEHERSRSRARRLDRLNQRYEFGLSLEQWLHRHPIVIPTRPDPERSRSPASDKAAADAGVSDQWRSGMPVATQMQDMTSAVRETPFSPQRVFFVPHADVSRAGLARLFAAVRAGRRRDELDARRAFKPGSRERVAALTCVQSELISGRICSPTIRTCSARSGKPSTSIPAQALKVNGSVNETSA